MGRSSRYQERPTKCLSNKTAGSCSVPAHQKCPGRSSRILMVTRRTRVESRCICGVRRLVGGIGKPSGTKPIPHSRILPVCFRVPPKSLFSQCMFWSMRCDSESGASTHRILSPLRAAAGLWFDFLLDVYAGPRPHLERWEKIEGCGRSFHRRCGFGALASWQWSVGFGV